MANELMIIRRDSLVKDNRFSNATDEINNALDDQLKQFYMLGAREVARNVDQGLLTMMKVNVRNERLSDSDCRQLMETLIVQWQEEIDQVLRS